ncbi:MAG: acyltransferase family protein [Candidatus Bathyarchaeota archaeon]|nr:acyltransferase family protein [Candidatus Bathyarchaeota archaeon]
MEKLNQRRSRALNVDLIRTIAIIGVILVHASGRWTVDPQRFTQMTQTETACWGVVCIYQSLATIGVPLFAMLTGALLLQPGKKESIRAFFKKRWLRVGLPFIFWGAIYFIWDFTVIKIPFSVGAIIQGILNGPYTHFWYGYVLVGLYLMTPILRVLLEKADQTIMKYFVAIWFLGVTITPLIGVLTPYTLRASLFTLDLFVGYFFLGTYLLTVQIRRQTTLMLMILGFALTVALTYLLAATVGGSKMYLFQQYFSPTVILASAMVFLLLATIQPPSTGKKPNRSRSNKLLGVISANTLSLYLLHVMILESIQNGYFGFTINRNIISPTISVPIETAITLFISLGIILLLKKVPYLQKLIG